jgi:RNA polymerase sigma factor (sigma-70 family)
VIRDFLLHTQLEFNTSHDDAEDFCQEFFIELSAELKKEHEFAPGMFSHWIKKCIKNDVTDWIRGHHDRFLALDEHTEEVADTHQPLQTDFWLMLGGEVRKLPQRERLIFILHYFKKRKFREIAARLHSHTNDVSKQYVRILAKLRKGRLRFFL